MVTGPPTNYYKTVRGRVSWRRRISVHDEKPPVIRSLPMARPSAQRLSISVNRKAGSFPISTRPRDQASGGRRAVRFSLPSALHAGEPRESDDLAARIGPAGPRRKPMLPYGASMIELAGVSFLVLLEGAQTLPRPLAWWDEQA